MNLDFTKRFILISSLVSSFSFSSQSQSQSSLLKNQFSHHNKSRSSKRNDSGILGFLEKPSDTASKKVLNKQIIKSKRDTPISFSGKHRFFPLIGSSDSVINIDFSNKNEFIWSSVKISNKGVFGFGGMSFASDYGKFGLMGGRLSTTSLLYIPLFSGIPLEVFAVSAEKSMGDLSVSGQGMLFWEKGQGMEDSAFAFETSASKSSEKLSSKFIGSIIKVHNRKDAYDLTLYPSSLTPTGTHESVVLALSNLTNINFIPSVMDNTNTIPLSIASQIIINTNKVGIDKNAYLFNCTIGKSSPKSIRLYLEGAFIGEDFGKNNNMGMADILGGVLKEWGCSLTVLTAASTKTTHKIIIPGNKIYISGGIDFTIFSNMLLSASLSGYYCGNVSDFASKVRSSDTISGNNIKRNLKLEPTMSISLLY